MSCPRNVYRRASFEKWIPRSVVEKPLGVRVFSGAEEVFTSHWWLVRADGPLVNVA